MTEPSMEQIRSFRLYAHHLDAGGRQAGTTKIAGACGLQNSPPGAWETALFNRVPDCTLPQMERLLYQDRSLLQAWSLRGLPVVFPAEESSAFLSALIPTEEETWIYTQGIPLALDFLQMGFEECLELLRQVIVRLDGQVIVSKTALDQTLADWILPLLPAEKQELWSRPSMYGSPDKQTVGGAAVSFLLRPCACCGLVVFGERDGISPTFTSYRNWTGHSFLPAADASKRLARKYLHCYGPATADMFAAWLGCSGKQARRIWASIADETEPVTVSGKTAWILSDDRGRLFASPSFSRELLLLGGHDPYLDQRDRKILQPDPALQKQIWKLVTNPGAIVYRGEVIGIWTTKKKGKGMEINMTLWIDLHQKEKQKLLALAEEYASFRLQPLVNAGCLSL